LNKIKLYLTYFSAVVSATLLFIPLYFAGRYFVEVDNPLRQELLVGMMLGSYIALFAWSITGLLAHFSRNLLSKRILRIFYAPAITLVVLLLIFTLVRFIASLSSFSFSS